MAAQRIRRERRQDERISAPDGAYAVMMPGSDILGPLIDVSRGGLSFRYLDGEKASARAKSSVSILYNRKRFYLSMMPCDVVADVEMENDVPFSALPVRRCSVRFRDASLFQDSQLRHFMTHHAGSDGGDAFFSTHAAPRPETSPDERPASIGGTPFFSA